MLALMLLSCEKERFSRMPSRGYTKSNVEVKAYPLIPEGWTPMTTKAVGDDINDAGLQSRGFGVYAFYTGSE